MQVPRELDLLPTPRCQAGPSSLGWHLLQPTERAVDGQFGCGTGQLTHLDSRYWPSYCRDSRRQTRKECPNVARRGRLTATYWFQVRPAIGSSDSLCRYSHELAVWPRYSVRRFLRLRVCSSRTLSSSRLRSEFARPPSLRATSRKGTVGASLMIALKSSSTRVQVTLDLRCRSRNESTSTSPKRGGPSPSRRAAGRSPNRMQSIGVGSDWQDNCLHRLWLEFCSKCG